jgi:hypothetical protein
VAPLRYELNSFLRPSDMRQRPFCPSKLASRLLRLPFQFVDNTGLQRKLKKPEPFRRVVEDVYSEKRL